MHQLFLLTASLLLGQNPHHPASRPVSPPLGHLIIAGGGPTISDITEKALSLAGGSKKAHVLIIPLASVQVDAGPRSEQFWRKAGARHVVVLDPKNKKAALAAVKDATLIWMPGGSQSRLMQFLNRGGLIDAIRDRFQHGATIGGTSAGAAVMSRLMLTGEARVDSVIVGYPKLAEGLGLWPNVIIDQHHLRRGRFNRLLSAVLNFPTNVGIGIDESTAVVVTGHYFEVIGKSNVIVIDARKAAKVQAKNGEPGAAANLALHLLKAGMKFDLDRGVVLK